MICKCLLVPFRSSRMAIFRFCCGSSATRPPYIDMSTRQAAWRLANVTMTLFFALAAVAQVCVEVDRYRSLF